jgi:hypothetical protein
MESNKKYPFDIKFEEQLVKALKGYAPWKDGFKFKSKKEATAPQLQLLKRLGYTGKKPETSGEASQLITQLKKV